MSASWDASRAQEIVNKYLPIKGPMLPILHALQEEFGFISDEAMHLVARSLNVTRAEIYGVVSFYHDFRQAPAGRHVLKICRAEACQSVGGEAHAAALLQSLGLEWGETTPDGRLTVEPVYCLGLCACGPNAMLDGEPRARLDAQTLHALAEEAA
nr:formate dehydrogenase subunit gamma [uncultured Acidocella sp.]